MNILSLLPEYTTYLKHERMLAESTITAYISDLKLLANAIPLALAEITLDHLRAYQRGLSSSGLKVNTIRRKFHGFSTFWKWARMENHVEQVITDFIRLPKPARKIPGWLNADDLLKFVNTPVRARDPFTARRNALAFRTLAWLGLRRAEMLNLRVGDVMLDTDIIIIRKSKGKKDRALTLPASLKTDFAELMGDRPAGEYMFGSTPGRPWGVQPFVKAFRRHLVTCGLAGRGITPHTLRHSFASHLIMRGAPLTDVKELLGHEDFKSTMIYVHLETNRLKQAMRFHVLNGGS